MPRSRSTAFPVGLYGALLLALCWLLLPTVFAPLERLLLGTALLPQRWLAWVGGTVAEAGSSGARDRLVELRGQLRERSWQADVEPGRSRMPASLEPLLCRVHGAERLGGGSMPSELRLDRTYEELAGCTDLVTKGDQLLGFLARPGVGTASLDRPTDLARVLLLNHPQSRVVAAAIHCDGAEPLRCVIEAAAAVDPSPLRTALHDDPYRAVLLRQGGGEVRTLALSASWIGTVPEGLGLGRARVWGYQRSDGDTLTIGIYVDPLHDPRALSSVVLWQAVPGAHAKEIEPEYAAARLQPLPSGQGGQWLVYTDRPVPDGAAVVQDGVCLGRARGVAFGQGIATSLQASQKPWALLLLPDDPSLPPQELFGEVVRADAATSWFRPRRGTIGVGATGWVFTGSNGPFCPAGLLVGRAEAESGRNLLRIALPSHDGPLQGSVVVGER